MEAIWNFFYWQTLSTNALDDMGHVLRLTALVNQCSPYEVKPTKEQIATCNQFLGPTQPGVTTPDPTASDAAAVAATARSGRRSARSAGAGLPHAPAPAPAPRATAPTRGAEIPALDFLLGQ